MARPHPGGTPAGGYPMSTVSTPESPALDTFDRVAAADVPRRESRIEARFGAVRTLRVLLIGSIIVPLLIGLAAGFFAYRGNYRHAVATLTEAVAVAEENTAKVLDTHLLVAARIDDLLAGLSDADIAAQEEMLHQRIAQQIKNLPQVAAAWVIDAQGREVVSARVYPVNRELDLSGREDFRALQDSRNPGFVWALRARSLDGGNLQPFFTVSRRRAASDGRFQGIVVVAVSGNYFGSFYNSLLGGSKQYFATVLREDGTSLARYPQTAEVPAGRQDEELLAEAIGGKATSGIIASGAPLATEGSVIAYKRLADYPVYVAIGRTRASILREWLDSVIGYIAIGFPAAIGFMLLTLLALRRTEREQAALAHARDAIAQRAAIAAQLHQAQKMEAVGLLTAGIAHDFNNLLTIVSGNIALLKADIEAPDARRQKFIASATSACERAAALTKRLLGFARNEPIDPRPVDVNDVIAGISDLPWRSLGDHIIAEFRLGGGLWPVFVDPNQLENAVLNLALNARDAMGGRGTLTVDTANVSLGEAATAGLPGIAPGDYVAVIVSDTGCGMPPEVREKAFDPFFTTKEPGKGTGLGLAQVYGFVTRFGGGCAIDSEPGRGASVKLYLPRYLGPATSGNGDAEQEKMAEPVADYNRSRG
jgi:signal transduction histidine kinase